MQRDNNMAEINTSALRDGVKEILENGDLNTLSSKRVRRLLEEKFGTDLTDRKQEIDNMVMSTITEMQAKKSSKDTDAASSSKISKETEENSVEDNNVDSDSSDISEEEDEDDEPPIKKKKPVSKIETQRPDKFKSKKTDKKAEKRKSAQLVDDSDSDYEEKPKTLNDEELARQLQEEEDGGRRTRNRNAKKPTTTPTTQKKKKERKGKSGYSAQMVLSPELAEIMGTDRMARHDVVKKMWEIIRERQLMDPKNKQFMLCDDQLFGIFGKKRIRTFGMMKYLKTHIKDPVYLADH